MLTRSLFGAAGVAAAGIAAALAMAAPSAPAAAEEPGARTEAAGERLGATIEQAIRADGPFFTVGERAVIERACGYPAGSWDGFEATLTDGALVCRDGRRVATPEVQAVIAAARPRIEARVEQVMASADVRGAIDEVSRIAEREALASIDHAAIARQAAEAAEEALVEAREAMGEARRARTGKR